MNTMLLVHNLSIFNSGSSLYVCVSVCLPHPPTGLHMQLQSHSHFLAVSSIKEGNNSLLYFCLFTSLNLSGLSTIPCCLWPVNLTKISLQWSTLLQMINFDRVTEWQCYKEVGFHILKSFMILNGISTLDFNVLSGVFCSPHILIILKSPFYRIAIPSPSLYFYRTLLKI